MVIYHGEKDSPLNERHTRNFNNTPRRNYNCGGFALRTYSWYLPVRDEDEQEYVFDTTSLETTPHDRLRACVRNILADIIGSRLIHSLDELQEGEEAVAFRLQEDGLEWSDNPDYEWQDFHFMRRKAPNVWLEKCGGREEIRRHTDHEVFDLPWVGIDEELVYDGEIALFAVKIWER